MAEDDTTTTEEDASKDTPKEEAKVFDFGEQLQSAVKSKLGELGLKVGDDGKLDTSNVSADNLKAGAQVVTGLMGQMLGALQQAAQNSGVDVQIGPSAGAASDTDESAGTDEGDNVIDLANEREKRGPREPSALEKRLVSNLKSTFYGYLRENAEVKEDVDGQPTANFNNDFIKNHGGRLVGSIFQAFAGSLLPTQFEFGGKKPTSEGAEDDSGEQDAQDAESSEDDELKVKMNLDLAGLFGQLFPSSAQVAKDRDDKPSDAGQAQDGASAEQDPPEDADA